MRETRMLRDCDWAADDGGPMEARHHAQGHGFTPRHYKIAPRVIGQYIDPVND